MPAAADGLSESESKMDWLFSRNLLTKSEERGSYHMGVRLGIQVDAASLDFSAEGRKADFYSTLKDDSTTEDNSFSHELHGRTCKKADGKPMIKRTVEVSGVVEKWRSSPSVIAKLMGLDELPHPQIVSESKNENGHVLLKKSFAGLQEKYESFENHSFDESRMQQQNFKIFHDLYDSTKTKKNNDQVIQEKKRSSRPDMAFMKQQFTVAKSLSLNKAHKKSRDFSDAPYILDVQEPNSLFAKNFDKTSWHRSATSIVVLKPSVQKAQSTRRAEPFPRPLENYKLSWKRHREFHGEFFVERGKQHRMFDVKTKGWKAKAGISCDISKQIKQSFRSYYEAVLASKIDRYDSISTSLTETSLRREEMKSLSGQWKAIRPYRLMQDGVGPSTLGEKLSLSDEEGPRTLGHFIFKKKFKNIDKEDIHYSSSRSGGKDYGHALLPRSGCLPNSSAIYRSLKPKNRHDVGCIDSIEDCSVIKDVYNQNQNYLHHSITKRKHSLLRNLKYNDNKQRPSRSCRGENRRSVRDFEVHQGESRIMINKSNLFEPKPIYLQSKMDGILHLVCDSSNSMNSDSAKYFLINLRDLHQPANFNDLSVIVRENEVKEARSTANRWSHSRRLLCLDRQSRTNHSMIWNIINLLDHYNVSQIQGRTLHQL